LLIGFDQRPAQSRKAAYMTCVFQLTSEFRIYTEGQGTQLLQRESVDASLHAAFEKRRAEGVTDDDLLRLPVF
jgi:hypothetical protein